MLLLIILIVIFILVLIRTRRRSNDVIYCFWTGSNEMSKNRRRALADLKKNSECNVILIDTTNLHKYIVPQYPLHEAYSYLHYTHRADYLRTYFMHVHGGGYSDIKSTGSWVQAFHDMNKNPHAYINGAPEKQAGDVAHPDVAHLYDRLVSNGAYIVRPQTEFTTQWFNEMNSLLDTKLPALKKMKTDPDVPINESSEYPIEWNEMLGRIFHRILAQYIHTGKILYTVPYPSCIDYR